MSRLIEALRKAEEEKRKEEAKKKAADTASPSIDKNNDDSPLSVQDEQAESLQETPSQEELPSDKQSIDFELEPIEPSPENSEKPLNPDTQEEGQNNDDASQTPRLTDDNIDEQSEASTATAESVPVESQRDFTRRQTDTIQLEVLPNKEDAPAKSRKPVWILFICLITLAFAGGYFFFLHDESNNQYPTNSYAQNRGFLDTPTNPENTTAPSINDDSPVLPLDTASNDENSLLEDAQNLLDNSLSTISDHTVETISAVNALLENNKPPVEQEITEVAPRSPILKIKRSATPKGASSSLSFARDNAQGGEHNAARMEYEELLRNQPTNRSALIGLATLEVKAGNNRLARQRYSQLLQIDPKDPIAQVGLIETNEEYDSATYEAELKSIASRYTSSAFIPFKLGNFFASQNRWSEAKHAYETALVTAQENNKTVSADYAFNLAVALEKTQRSAFALKKYEEALELSKSSPFSFDAETLNNRIDVLQGALSL